MIDIEINVKDMEAIVHVGNKLPPAKREKITKEEFKEYMVELSGNNIDVMRKVSKLFKPISYTFTNVKG